jgi:hypothetical protein
MNQINKEPITSLGYQFISKKFIPKGKNEYYLRNIQNRSGTKHRKLTAQETEILVRNGNSSDNWDNLLVSDYFDPELVKHCAFYGLVRIGKLEASFVEFNNFRLPVGLYDSTIISCDIGDNVAINNVNYMSHYIVGNDVMLANINELATTDHSKFGNGVLKEGENESIRVWMEVCNENAGRSVLPFNGMMAGDAWLWSKFRDDKKLLEVFKKFTDNRFDTRRGYYGKIGDRTVIKNCSIIKDVWVGSDAYIKGANKLKNLTINSSPEAHSQIGEGCELVNGIIGYGCRIFYGVKAVRFMLGTNSQLKYGARLINSYLGDNSTISCCEVLNSLIFPGHEQHHNNSFLCAAVVLGQSNMAAGATIGSNHNSRGADGEIIAGRGFWPGLCVSLKHNSRFASFSLIAKGDFPNELDIPIPFSLISNDTSNDCLLIRPAYWFQYNMYALARNAAKYRSRDKRLDKSLVIEYDYLAPDTINEIFQGLDLLKLSTGEAITKSKTKPVDRISLVKAGGKLLEKNPGEADSIEVNANGFENSRRKVRILKPAESYHLFKNLVTYYGTLELVSFFERKRFTSWEKFVRALPFDAKRIAWKNIGGQLIPETSVKTLLRDIRSGKLESWDDVHAFYRKKSNQYEQEKFQHAFASLLEISGLRRTSFTKKAFISLLNNAVATKQQMLDNIIESRKKDYTNPFRQMVYDNTREMEMVTGKFSENAFILQQKEEFLSFKLKIKSVVDWLTTSRDMTPPDNTLPRSQRNDRRYKTGSRKRNA